MTDPLQKARALEADHNKRPRESNRQRWPEIAAFVDEQRKLYGDGISVIKIIDNPEYIRLE